jgi:23S rRNA (uracil1939-C5)-methyltransferase
VNSPKIGIFEAGTHNIVDIPHCPIHAPAINRVVRAVKSAVRTTRTPLYSEHAHAGLLRYLQLVVERRSGQVQLVVVCNDREPTTALPLLRELQQQLGDALHSLVWNGQPEANNRILGEHWYHHAGPLAVTEHLGGSDVHYPPGAFGQANLDLFERIVDAIHAACLPELPLVELYAGVGAIGLGLASKGTRVVFNEVGAGSLQGLAMGIAALPPVARGRVRVVSGAAEDVVGELPLQGAQVIVDPPRKGLHERVVAELLAAQAPRLVYLSCGVDSFLRDAEALVAGGYRCGALEAFALFPFTEHAEILGIFDNSSAR